MLTIRKLILAVALCLIANGRSFAQEAVASPTPEQTPTPIASPLPSASEAPLPKIPTLEELDQAFKKTPLGKEADELRMRRELRELSNRTINNADLVTMRVSMEAAQTDLEKRDRLRVYYTKFYDRMRAKADSPELKNYIDGQKTAHLNGTAQNRVRPSPTAIPTPTPKPKPANIPEPALPQQ